MSELLAPNDSVLSRISENGVMTLTLNRPSVLNTFNAQMHAALRSALATANDNPAVAVVVITGAGRGFCAGQDLAALGLTGDAEPADLGQILQDFYAPLIEAIASHRCPIIAAVNGITAGAGVSLALACDIVVASASASFTLGFTKIGLIADAGATHYLVRHLGRARALGWALTNEKIPAAQLQTWGLIWKCIEAGEFLTAVETIAADVAKTAPLANAALKKALRSSGTLSLQENLMNEALAQRRLGKSADYREGVLAFLEKRAARFTGV